MKKFKKKFSFFALFIVLVGLMLFILKVCREIATGHILNNLNFANPIFEFEYALNEGAAFGLLQQKSAFLCGVAGFILCFVFYYVFNKGKKISNLERFAIALVTSGIIANTFERLQTGAVVDYINLSFVHFPIFNFADVFITFGAIILIFIMFFKKGN